LRGKSIQSLYFIFLCNNYYYFWACPSHTSLGSPWLRAPRFKIGTGPSEKRGTAPHPPPGPRKNKILIKNNKARASDY
jgi:hypothetical protein